jgi:hypothetical protein
MAQFICPITQIIMTDPVICQDGHCYERSAIKEWLKNNSTSPNTREQMGKVLLTNHSMRSELSAAGHFVKPLNKSTSNAIDKGTSRRITLVLDVSGSMNTSVEEGKRNEPSFSRLDLIKHAVSSIAAMMPENDQLCIVTFSDIAKVVMPWTKMDDTGKELAHNTGKKLYVQGGTNISIGVEVGVEQGGDHTILLTDGANSFQPPRGTLADSIINKITKYTGKIHSVGLGMANDLDTPTLRAISSNKGGLYCFCPDASMVGTVFIHLMANICVNEPGVPFEEHEQFMKIIITVAETRKVDSVKFKDPILNADLISSDNNKGQVKKAIDNWDTWGRHYLPAFIDAHIRYMTTNFKDASLQGYASTNTRLFIDAGEGIFLGIEPPKPSCNNYTNSGYNAVQFASTTLNSQGVCFSGSTELRILENGKIITCKIKDIKKGMCVVNKNNTSKVLCVVVSPATEMINLGNNKGFWVSKKHPLRESKDSIWRHADNFPYKLTEMCECYNLVLETGHIIDINEFEAVTLGHNMKGDIIEHDYLGTSKIINDLSKFKEYHEGFIRLNGLKRNNNGYICGIIF